MRVASGRIHRLALLDRRYGESARGCAPILEAPFSLEGTNGEVATYAASRFSAKASSSP